MNVVKTDNVTLMVKSALTISTKLIPTIIYFKNGMENFELKHQYRDSDARVNFVIYVTNNRDQEMQCFAEAR